MTIRKIVQDSLVSYARKEARKRRPMISVKYYKPGVGVRYRAYGWVSGLSLPPSTMAQAFANAVK